MSEEGRILAIDFGKRRIGLAISDPTKTIASPLRVIYTGRENPILTIKKIIKEHNIKEIIIGYPLLLSGYEGEMAKEVKRFYNILKGEVRIPVYLVDERFTTKIAETLMRKRGMKPSKERDKTDLFSACVLLEYYLNKRE